MFKVYLGTFIYLFILNFDAESHCVVISGLELIMETRLTSICVAPPVFFPHTHFETTAKTHFAHLYCAIFGNKIFIPKS